MQQRLGLLPGCFAIVSISSFSEEIHDEVVHHDEEADTGGDAPSTEGGDDGGEDLEEGIGIAKVGVRWLPEDVCPKRMAAVLVTWVLRRGRATVSHKREGDCFLDQGRAVWGEGFHIGLSRGMRVWSLTSWEHHVGDIVMHHCHVWPSTKAEGASVDQCGMSQPSQDESREVAD